MSCETFAALIKTHLKSKYLQLPLMREHEQPTSEAFHDTRS